VRSINAAFREWSMSSLSEKANLKKLADYFL
jgi:hypothetical protein